MALIRSDVSDERKASIVRVKRICELGTTLAVTSNHSYCGIPGYCFVLSSLILSILMIEAIFSSATLVHARALRHHIPEAGIPHSHAVKTANLA
jgi:hypothetical protein